MKLSYDEIAYFCRQLALLLHAGIGAADGVFLLAEEETGTYQSFLKELGKQMDGGEHLSVAMERCGAFPASFTGMVTVGEQTGRLEEVLESMARFYDQRSRSGRQIKNAIAYPAALLALMLMVVGVLLIKVLPVFDDVYHTLGSRLSGVAASLLQLGQLLKGAMPVLFALLAVLVLMILLYGFYEPLRNEVNAWWRKRFGDRGISRRYNNASFARALAMGLGSGLPLETAVEQAGKLLEDVPEAAMRCDRCAELLRSGAELPFAMETSGFLLRAESRMLAVGLKQGNSDQIMENIADRLLEQAEETLENTVAKIEPAMVLLASALVGAILLAVMLPLMNIMAAIG